MGRLDAKWNDFTARGQAWDSFWQDGPTAVAGAEAATGADASSLAASPTASPEAGTGADAAVIAALYARGDSGVGIDLAAVTASYVATDAATGSDLAALIAAMAASDTGAAADAASVVSGNPIAASDVGIGIDMAAVGIVNDVPRQFPPHTASGGVGLRLASRRAQSRAGPLGSRRL